MVAIAGWVLTSHSPTHGGRCRQPDVHVLSTDYHRGHKDLLKCHWGGDFLDECLTAVLGCLLRYPTLVRTASCLWLIWPTGTINLVPAKLGSLKWRRPFLPGRGLYLNAGSASAPSTGPGAYAPQDTDNKKSHISSLLIS